MEKLKDVAVGGASTVVVADASRLPAGEPLGPEVASRNCQFQVPATSSVLLPLLLIVALFVPVPVATGVQVPEGDCAQMTRNDMGKLPGLAEPVADTLTVALREAEPGGAEVQSARPDRAIRQRPKRNRIQRGARKNAEAMGVWPAAGTEGRNQALEI